MHLRVVFVSTYTPDHHPVLHSLDCIVDVERRMPVVAYACLYSVLLLRNRAV